MVTGFNGTMLSMGPVTYWSIGISLDLKGMQVMYASWKSDENGYLLL